MLFGFRNAYSPSGLDEAVSQVISVLNNITYPKSNAHFPMDLNSANNILQRLIMILVEENLPSNHTVCQVIISIIINHHIIFCLRILLMHLIIYLT